MQQVGAADQQKGKPMSADPSDLAADFSGTPALPDWADFRHRLWRATYMGAIHGAITSVGADILTGNEVDFHILVHVGLTIFASALAAAVTALKSLIAQGRGTNPADGSLR